MADADIQEALRYSAFISYSHKDAAFARRLHRQLETYRLPRRLAASHPSRITAARRLRPIFRDQSGFAAAPDLNDAVQQAIAESTYLIVICSQESQASGWVAREVAYFRSRHGPGGVLAVLIEGATPDALSAAFGYVTPAECAHLPLAADFRRAGDGGRLALLKLVAVLAGVRLDELVQRDAQRRVRQITFISGGALGGMALMSVLTLVALNARATAEHERNRGERLIEYLLTDMRTRLKGAGRLDLLDALNEGAIAYYREQDLSSMPDASLQQRAKLLQAIGDNDAKRGDFKAAEAQFTEAERTTAALLKARPNDQQRMDDHAQSEFYVGFINWRLGNYVKAQSYFMSYASLANHLIQIAPTDPRWLKDAGDADSNLGMFLLRQLDDLPQAEKYFTTALAKLQAAAAQDPNDIDIQLDVADGYGWLGDINRREGKCDKAFENRNAEDLRLNEMLKRDARNAEVRTAQTYNDLALARIYICQNKLSSALGKLKEGYDVAAELQRDDPQNIYLQKQLGISKLFEALILMMTPDAERRSGATITADLGNCDADAGAPNNQELATFCIILRARHLAITGDKEGARRPLATLSRSPLVKKGKLSERWGISFYDEIRAVQILIDMENKK